MIDTPSRTFFDLLDQWNTEASSVGNEDLLAAVLPLMRQMAETHARRRCAARAKAAARSRWSRSCM